MALTVPTPHSIESSYSLSPMQQGMLFHHLQARQPGVDIEQIVADLHEDVDAFALVQAWQRVVARHAILRTSFRWRGLDEPQQVVHAEIAVPFVEEDWRGIPAAEQRQRLDLFLRTDRQRAFDLATPPLLRVALLRRADRAYTLVWTFHHILLDGRAFPLVLRELFALYEAPGAGDDLELPSPRPFEDHVAWLAVQDLAGAESFWRQSLRGFTTPTPLVVERQRGGGSSAEAGHRTVELRLTEATTTQLRAFAERHELTLNTLVQGAWSLLLSRYSGEDEVVFGATRACRHSSVDGADAMVGIFINTLPVRARVTPERPLIPWLRELRASQIAVRPYEHTPLTKVQEWSDVPRGTPIFESLLMFDNASLDATLRGAGGAWLRRSFRLLEETNFPLTLHAYGEPSLLLDLEYAPERFDAAAVERMLGHLRTILEAMLDPSASVVGDLPMLTAIERQQVLVGWNVTAADYPLDTLTLHGLVEAQVARTPDAIAVACEGDQLTYAQLDLRARQLAAYLHRRGVGPGTLVGVCLERSFELVVALLGILKAGGAYVPLDPAYPAERLAFMLEDSATPVLLTSAGVAARLPTTTATMLRLDSDWSAITGDWRETPVVAAGPDDLAYVIYTSGSTGRPKGAMNSHRGIVNRLLWMQNQYALTPEDRILQKTPFSFDVSVWEFFWPLMTGARLVMARPGGHGDPAYLVDTIAREGITTLHFVPSMLQAFLTTRDVARCASVRRIICSGEALPVDLQDRCLERLPVAGLYNLYGPTEAAVDVSHWTCRREPNQHTVPIGRPVANTQLYILDARLEPTPIGVPGELHIGGVQVGRGYLNRPELTAERFVPDPFAAPPGARLYKTGDLARWRPDGAIEYLGRLDHQVKIRGLRIELEEIEAALAAHPAVREAIVLAREDTPGDKRLVAYLTASGEAPAAAALREHLGRQLPDYMVPSAFVTLGALPLSPNGKIDRKALPAPTTERDAAILVAPRSTLERDIAAIWAELLQVKQLGLGDNFFELGGHSLLIVRLQSRLQEQLGREVAVVDLFRYPTVGALAAFLDQATPSRPSFTEAQSRAANQRQALARQRQVVKGGRSA